MYYMQNVSSKMQKKKIVYDFNLLKRDLSMIKKWENS